MSLTFWNRNRGMTDLSKRKQEMHDDKKVDTAEIIKETDDKKVDIPVEIDDNVSTENEDEEIDELEEIDEISCVDKLTDRQKVRKARKGSK